jgi:asparagine synthase (glutamine-hydrolysing)
MCAIHGIVDVKPELMMKMVKTAHHRGPDGNSIFKDDYITLGHNLLSIVGEVEDGKQPYEYENCVLVYNGEIYNYKDLEHNSKNDTEALAKGLKNEGWEFLKKCDGMFALAFYNKTTKELILARDTNGTKPLYYGYIKDKLYFSSEIKSLLECGFERKVCKKALGLYYNQGYVPGYLTMFEGIKKLVPGQVLVNDKSYNLLDYKLDVIDNIDIDHVKREVQLKHNYSVQQTLMGRRNIGLFLSGGLDSSSILYEMKELGLKPRTFTSSFATTDPKSLLNHDSKLAERLCKEWGIENNVLYQTQQDYVDSIEDAFYALEEPRQGKSFPTYYNMNKFISSNDITVTLAGDGGDELFAGYKHHIKQENWQDKLFWLRAYNTPLKNSELRCSLNDQMNYLNEWLPVKQLQEDELNNFLYTESLNSLAEDFLVRNDKLGMAFSMEGRFPIINKTLRDYVRALPSELKIDEKFSDFPKTKHKYLQRKSYEGLLPDYILNHRKTGWRFPTDEILIGRMDQPAPDKGVLKDYIRETLNDKELMDIFEYEEKDIEDRYLNNREHVKNDKGTDKAGPGLKSQKELFCTLNFAVWKKVYNMSL